MNSALCKDEACTLHQRYDPKTSKTFSFANPLIGMEITYASGMIQGVHAYEDVYFGNLKIPHMSLYLIIDQLNVLDAVLF